MPDGHMMTIAFAIGVTTRELKEHFANELKVPSRVIQLSLDGKSCEVLTLCDSHQGNKF